VAYNTVCEGFLYSILTKDTYAEQVSVMGSECVSVCGGRDGGGEVMVGRRRGGGLEREEREREKSRKERK
jgi:hypothetical protein